MKILIAYYSRTASTEKLANSIKDEFILQGHQVDIEKVAPVKEHSFWYWFYYRFFKGECEILPPKIADVSSYDLICIGSPNWTRLSAPMAKYLSLISGMEYKNVGLFATTYLQPAVEWYVFSAYLLDLTFTKIIEDKRGRFLSTLLLSSKVKDWDYQSVKGKELIKDFCRKLIYPVKSYRNYLLEYKEREEVRFLIILLAPLIYLFPVIEALLLILKVPTFTLPQFYFLMGLGLALLISLLVIMERNKNLNLGKYLTGAFLSVTWTLIMIFAHPELGRTTVLGYALILSIISLFREPRAVFYTGTASLISYFVTYFSHPTNITFSPHLDISLIILSTLMISIVTKSLQSNFLKVLDTQAELELAREKLEDKLKELNRVWAIAEQEKEKTQSIITHLADGLLVFDIEGKLNIINPAAQNLLECSEDQVIKRHIYDLKDNENFNLIFEILDQNQEHKEITLKNNHLIEARLIRVENINLNSIMQVILLHDVTEERRLEEMKVDFASIAAHELRTPLTALRGYLSLLNKSTDIQKLGDQDKHFLDRAILSCTRLSTLVDSLLAVTRVERGQSLLNIEPLSISNLIDETVSEYKASSGEKNQSVEIIIPDRELPVIKADKLKVKEILSNLISNAIRYTGEGGHIKISSELRDNFIEVNIEDNGQGIDEEIQPYLFTKFIRGENALRKETKGVGLGLYLVKSLLEMQGGKIWFKSAPKQGSTFSFNLPCNNDYDKN